MTVELNPPQQQAIEHVNGPLLVVAGAGTGKTRVIVEKIKSLIIKHNAPPESILALTFTDKAAGEMEERIDEALPYGYFQMQVSTFHAFAHDILQKELIHIGLNPNYHLMNKSESVLLFKKYLHDFDLKYFRQVTSPYRFLADMIGHFGRLQDEVITPTEYLAWAQTSNPELNEDEMQRNLELATSYQRYQQLKEKMGMFEHGDVLFYLHKLWHERPNILRQYQDRHRYCLVDEFQDTNLIQYELIKMLCPPTQQPNLTVVGDDSQAIYKFRGASVSNILSFMKDYPQATQITLVDNYRSCQEILDCSYKLVSHNNPDTLETKLGISKKLKSHRKSTQEEPVAFTLTDESSQEAEYIASEILQLIDKHDYKFNDIAILVRASKHAEPLMQAFAHRGIRYQFVGAGALFRQPVIKNLIAYLHLLDDLSDSASCYRILMWSALGIDARDVNLLVAYARKVGLDLYQALDVYCHFQLGKNEPIYKPYQADLPPLLPTSVSTLIQLNEVIRDHLGKLMQDNAGQILLNFLERMDLLKDLYSRHESVAADLIKFFGIIQTFTEMHEDDKFKDFVSYLDLALENGESPGVAEPKPSYDAVQIMTVHGAKGLEFPIVFLPSLVSSRFPNMNRKEALPLPDALVKEILPQGDSHLQEERRLFYVALTRAQEKVYLTAAKKYSDAKRLRKLSIFIGETIGLEKLRQTESIKAEQDDQLALFKLKTEPTANTISTLHKIGAISHSKLQTFITCPKQYYFQYVIKIPAGPKHFSASFGETIHKALQYFGMELQQDPNLTVERLIELYKLHWIPLGYRSSAHQESTLREGEQILRRFYAKFPLQSSKILALEKIFRIKLDDETTLTGKIDRIDRIDDAIEIIDYKTGKVPDIKKLEQDWQLMIYALAAHDPNLCNASYDKLILSFYYLNSDEKISLHKTEDEVNEVKTEIQKIAADMRTSKFEARPGFHCQYCQFNKICDQAI